MKFQTPAFVRVENPQERKELDMWLRDIGYVVDRKFGSFLFARHQTARHGYEIEYDPADGVIDCGTNIPLFKALAAINDENDREQWFIDRSTQEMHLCQSPDLMVQNWYNHYFDKATAEEIINYFKNKDNG